MPRSLFFSIVLLVSVVLGAYPSFAQTTSSCDTLTRNLKQGMSGADVLLVQQILNRAPSTRIASAGIGSPGYETTYFGTRTRLAVIKFQNLYRTKVLTPYGLKQGTGFVGAST